MSRLQPGIPPSMRFSFGPLCHPLYRHSVCSTEFWRMADCRMLVSKQTTLRLSMDLDQTGVPLIACHATSETGTELIAYSNGPTNYQAPDWKASSGVERGLSAENCRLKLCR